MKIKMKNSSKIMNVLMRHESFTITLPTHYDLYELAERFNPFFNEKIATIDTQLGEHALE